MFYRALAEALDGPQPARRPAKEAEMKRVFAVAAIVILAGSAAAVADTLHRGDSELSLDLSYVEVDRDDGGRVEEADLSGRYGRMLSDAHEIGVELFYSKEGGFEGIGAGVLYDYNFVAGDNLNPFVGATYAPLLEGDLGDIYDSAYGLRLGVKAWPFDHAGAAFGVSHFWLQGSGSGVDAEQLSLFGSLRLKF